MTRLQRLTDSFAELVAYAATAVLIATGSYQYFEDKGFWDSLWWAIVTLGTVGYGDQFPVTPGGRIVSGLLILFSVLFLVPLITARMVGAADFNGWTHEEQEQIKADLALLVSRSTPTSLNVTSPKCCAGGPQWGHAWSCKNGDGGMPR